MSNFKIDNIDYAEYNLFHINLLAMIPNSSTVTLSHIYKTVSIFFKQIGIKIYDSADYPYLYIYMHKNEPFKFIVNYDYQYHEMIKFNVNKYYKIRSYKDFIWMYNSILKLQQLDLSQ